MGYLSNTVSDPKNEGKTKTRLTPLGYFLGLIILAIFVLIGLAIAGVFNSEKVTPEQDMRKQVMQIKPLNMDKEPFNNDLPNPATSLNIAIDSNGLTDGSTDYSDVIASQALEPTVFAQHKTYVNEKNKVTNTASFLPEPSHSEDVNVRQGLRMIQYQINGKDMVDDTARQVPSVIDASQLNKPTNLRWN
jgi:hypothetical protein